MNITGQQLIGYASSNEGEETFLSISPIDNKAIDDVKFHNATTAEIERAASMAKVAFASLRKITKERRSDFLEKIADEIMALGEDLIRRCMQESALPEGRLVGERGRTVNQLKLFAQVVRDGNWVDARIDASDPSRIPVPKPDIRSMLRPLGPAAVFGASNFPLAFSVAGGDTASALAAGCPVVVKAHPAHPGTSEMVARAILNAAKKTGMPDGVFSMIQGRTHEVGSALVRHPSIKAAGFTGSQKGGLALLKIAQSRDEPIPFFGEMGSVNPIFILPGAVIKRGESIATGLVNSVNLGVGQFCTNPGLVFVKRDSSTPGFLQSIGKVLMESSGATMLTKGICSNYEQGVHQLQTIPGVQMLYQGKTQDVPNYGRPTIFTTNVKTLLSRKEIMEEVFGPSSIIVQAENKEEFLSAARELEGHLTATIHGTREELVQNAELVYLLEEKVGRLIFNGFPTGVEVCHAMIHGGPYPATTDSRMTSVGTLAIKRFARPVCFQDFPQISLPDALKDNNPWGIFRMVNGELTKDAP